MVRQRRRQNEQELARLNRKVSKELADPLKLEAAHEAALQVVRDHNRRKTASYNAERAQSFRYESSKGAAYMCGVCGLVYASEQACEDHETRHISDVLVGLGYLAAPAELPLQDGGGSRTIIFEDELLNDGYPGLDADIQFDSHDDLLGHTSTADHAGDQLLVDTQDMVVFTDDALVDVVKRAEPLMLTDAEKEAERALQLLARDKEHYDGLAKRAMERKVNPASRYRSEEKGIRGKFQNKLLDAYQLMKESDGKKGIRDQYKQKKKKSGDEEAVRILQRSNKTLYVNVIVKNSVQVVRHELERLAKRRWEVPGQENFTRFERFRVYTQAKAVKLAGMALATDFTVRWQELNEAVALIEDVLFAAKTNRRSAIQRSIPLAHPAAQATRCND